MELSMKNSGSENFTEPLCDIAANKELSSLLRQKTVYYNFFPCLTM